MKEETVVDREMLRKELKCKLYPLNTLKTYKYTVICSYYDGNWVLSKHKNVIHMKPKAAILKTVNHYLMQPEENFMKKVELRMQHYTQCVTTWGTIILVQLTDKFS